MGRPTIDYPVIDFDVPGTKKRLVTELAPLKGKYRVSIEPTTATRRQCANNYYWGLVVEPFGKFLNDQEVQKRSKDQVHLILKAAILGVEPTVNPVTGEVIPGGEVVPDTHTMTIGEFYDYVERVRDYLSDMFHIVTADPDPDFAAAREAVRQ